MKMLVGTLQSICQALFEKKSYGKTKKIIFHLRNFILTPKLFLLEKVKQHFIRRRFLVILDGILNWL